MGPTSCCSSREHRFFPSSSLLPSPVSARGRVSYPEPASTGSGLWVLQTGKETEPRVFFHPQHLRDSALSLREQGICAVWPGLLQDQWWPQGGRLCTPFFGEQKLASELLLNSVWGTASIQEGERAFHPAGAAMTPGRGQCGDCSKPCKIQPLARKWLRNSTVSQRRCWRMLTGASC